MIKKKINKIIIEYIPDNDADLDYLGKFSNEPSKFAVKHEPINRNEYKYFNADNVDNMKHAKENYKRMMDYEKGNFSIYGVKATAEIYTEAGQGSWLINKISSGGLWRLESDGGEENFKEVEAEQLDDLKDVLLALGFTAGQIARAPREIKKD